MTPEQLKRELATYLDKLELATDLLERVIIKNGAGSWTDEERDAWASDYKDFTIEATRYGLLSRHAAEQSAAEEMRERAAAAAQEIAHGHEGESLAIAELLGVSDEAYYLACAKATAARECETKIRSLEAK